MVVSSGSNSNSLPHILLIVTDQMRFDAFNPHITPNLYELSMNTNTTTTTFTNAFVSTPTCTPARAALLTGRSTWNHGMLGYDSGVSCENYTTTLPSILANYLGYKTIVVGKNHFGTKEKEDQHQQQHSNREFITHGYQNMKLYEGLTFDENINIEDDYDTFFNNTFPGVDPLSTCDLGWNDWNACPYKFDEHIHPTSWTTRQVLNIINDNKNFLDYFDNNDDDDDDDKNNDHRQQQKKKEQHPIFLKISYHRPHSPYDPPKRLWDKHMKKKDEIFYKRNINNNGGMNNNSSWDQEYMNTTKMSHDAWHGDPGDDDLARTSRAAYMANVEFVDESIGIILNKLRSKRKKPIKTSSAGSPSTTLLDDMLIIWTSDHGDMNGDHNLWRKGYPYEASTHINMIMKMPTTSTGTGTTATNANAGGSKTKTTKTKTSTNSIASNKVSDAIVENRDIAATIYDYLGILDNVTKIDPLMNGISLMNIIRGGKNNNTVRSYLDLEHSTLYNDGRIHWNAIIGILPSNLTMLPNTNTNTNDNNNNKNSNANGDEHSNNNRLYKYIFFPMNGTEQLFCITDDPNERYDLVVPPLSTPSTTPDAAHDDGGDDDDDSILKFWRQTLIKQFQNEGRGEKWVTKEGNLAIGRKGVAHGSNYPCPTSYSHSRSQSPEISSSYSGNSTTLTAR
jgi:arylsulfatase